MTQSNEKWSWWVGSSEERFDTECDTREEAEAIAREEYEGAWIIEAQKPDSILLSKYFDAESFLERADERAWDYHGDPEGDAAVFEDAWKELAALQEMVRAAIDQWQEKHGLIFTSWKFSATRNLEYIPGAQDDD